MITIVGGGFAGVEAAWAAANRGCKVRLYEMRPVKMTPAHETSLLSELVCSNSFKSQSPDTPAGLLKAEMKALGSLVIPTGEEHSVPGGSALCVDRGKYAAAVTAAVEGHGNIEVVREEFTAEMAESLLTLSLTLSQGRGNMGALIIATGPLTSEGLGSWLAERTGREHLYFYDAVSPTVDASTIDRDVADMVPGLRCNVWPTDLTREHHVRQQKVNLRFLFQDIQSVASVLGGYPWPLRAFKWSSRFSRPPGSAPSSCALRRCHRC